MSYLTNKRIFYINSHERIEGSHSNFQYNIQIPPYEFDGVCLLSAVIPKSYYLIRNGKNTFTLQELGVNYTITIPIGNYSATSLRSTLATALSAASGNGWVYTVTYPNISTSANTGKFTFTVSGNTGQPSFIFTTNVYEVLGFEPNSTVTFTANTLTSVNVVKLQVEDTLLLHSDICSNGKDDILNEIFIAASPDFSNIKYQCPDVQAYSKSLSTQNNNVYRFSLTDEDGNMIDLNGLNIVLTLVLYKTEDIMKNYIKFQLLKEK
jgi:hypothetical protein